jgi:nitrous oxidase accessory protein
MRVHPLIIPIIALFLAETTFADVISIVPGQSIQEAVDAANAGDIIEVHSGYYYENVNVTKPLTLRGMGGPVVDAGGKGSAITLSASGISIDGFTAVNSSRDQAGINVDSISCCNEIRGNAISENRGNGIDLWASRNNSIEGNTCSRNGGDGISLWSFDNNSIKGNILTQNSGTGIFGSCGNSSIVNNSICLNNESGIVLLNSLDNRIADNLIQGNKESGIMLILASANVVAGNNASYNAHSGIALLFSWQNIIMENRMANNLEGLGLGNSSGGNVISYNAIAFNKLGVNIAGSSGNMIHHNRFEANDYDSYDDGENQWDDGTEGNYYRDLSCKDLNNDKVCDESLPVPGGTSVDNYPFKALY